MTQLTLRQFPPIRGLRGGCRRGRHGRYCRHDRHGRQRRWRRRRGKCRQFRQRCRIRRQRWRIRSVRRLRRRLDAGHSKKHRNREQRRAGRKHRRASSLRAHRFRIEDCNDACAQRGVRHADRTPVRSRDAAHVCSHVQQELGVVGRNCARAQNCIVARALLQIASVCRGKPHERVIPMQCARESRYQGADGVAPPNVGELVQERAVTRRFGPRISGCRQQQHRSQHTPGTRARDVLRFEHAHATIEFGERRCPTRGFERVRMASPARETKAGQQLAREKDGGADEPDPQQKPPP